MKAKGEQCEANLVVEQASLEAQRDHKDVLLLGALAHEEPSVSGSVAHKELLCVLGNMRHQGRSVGAQ